MGSLKTIHYLGRNLNIKKIYEEEDESIMFISQYRPNKNLKDVEKDILKILDEYAFKKNITLKINLTYKENEIWSKKKLSITIIFFSNLKLN